MNRILYNAAISGDVLFLRQLAAVSPQFFKAGVPQFLMTEVPQEQQTALHIAARSGHMEFVREILRLCGGSLAKKQNNQGDTALHCAARNGKIGVIRILIENAPSFEVEREGGGLLRMRNKQGNTALHEALIHGHDEVALRLLETDPKLAILPNSNVQTSLHLAARGALFEVFKKILAGLVVLEEKIEVVKIRDNAGRTALHYAAAGGEKEEIVALLLKTDSSIAYDFDGHGLSPLHIAAASGSIETIIELIKHCPDAMEQRDPTGRNAFHISILNRLKFGNLERLKATVNEYKKIVNEPNAEGNTPLHLAAKFVCYPLVKELLNLGNAELNVRNNDGLTPLDLAESARVHHPALAEAVVRVLEDHGGCSGKTWEEPYISDGTVCKNETAS